MNGILAKSSTDLKVNQVEIRFGNKLLLVKVLEMKDSTKKRKMAGYEIISETRVEKMSKNIVPLNNSFIQNEYQRRRYLMKERQNGIVLWGGY